MRIRFGDCVVDTERRQVSRDAVEVPVSPKAYQLLTLLVDARPKALAKDYLYKELWPDTFVVDANLPNLIAEIRGALGDSAQQPRIIRTVHGFGYAFCADAEIVLPADASQFRTHWLLWEGRALPLGAGENVIGRGPDVQVRLDTPGVSRRHARILVDGEHVVIEDLDSKNGTFVGGERVTAARALAGGDEVSLGSVRVTFHATSPEASTETTKDRTDR